MEESLPDDVFVRIHHQYIVNIKFISHIKRDSGGNTLYISDDDDTVLPVGRAFIVNVKEKLKI